MSKNDKKTNPTHAVDDSKWGKEPEDNFGYNNEDERHTKRGLEDWEMVAHMETTQQAIPYWFAAIFIVLLLVAIGLTFPFWGNRDGYERAWFDWGIPAGAAWVIVMSGLIYYMVDYRHVLREKKEAKEAAEKEAQKSKDEANNQDT